MKKCNKCKIEKPLTEFYTVKRKTKISYLYKCKKCKNKDSRKYTKDNREQLNEYYRKRYHDPKLKENNKARTEKWAVENPEHNLNYRRNNPEKVIQWRNNFKLNNPDKIKIYSRKYYKKNKADNPYIYRWRGIFSNTLTDLNQQKTSSTRTMMGYSAIELKEHLDGLGMNWNSDQVDHIIPLSWFKNDTPIHVVNDLRNLQPLSPQDNLKKGNRFVINKNFSYINEVKHWIKEDRLNQL